MYVCIHMDVCIFMPFTKDLFLVLVFFVHTQLKKVQGTSTYETMQFPNGGFGEIITQTYTSTGSRGFCGKRKLLISVVAVTTVLMQLAHRCMS